MIVKVEDGWAIGYCSKGMRAFAARHKLDWADICANGIDEERLLQTGDHMAHKLVEQAHGRKKLGCNRI